MAAQILTGLGFREVYNLKGGIRAWDGQKATGPQELNMERIRGNEDPLEMVGLAYGMELAVQGFYRTMGSKSKDRELVLFFAKMARVEESHKKRLFELQAKLNPSSQDLAAFEQGIHTEVMEGGLDPNEFAKENEAYLESLSGVVHLAMMLEAQALDLYLRFSRKCEKSETKEILFKIAREEKNHLDLLGRFLEKEILGRTS